MAVMLIFNIIPHGNKTLYKIKFILFSLSYKEIEICFIFHYRFKICFFFKNPFVKNQLINQIIRFYGIGKISKNIKKSIQFYVTDSIVFLMFLLVSSNF